MVPVAAAVAPDDAYVPLLWVATLGKLVHTTIVNKCPCDCGLYTRHMQTAHHTQLLAHLCKVSMQGCHLDSNSCSTGAASLGPYPGRGTPSGWPPLCFCAASALLTKPMRVPNWLSSCSSTYMLVQVISWSCAHRCTHTPSWVW